MSAPLPELPSPPQTHQPHAEQTGQAEGEEEAGGGAGGGGLPEGETPRRGGRGGERRLRPLLLGRRGG